MCWQGRIPDGVAQCNSNAAMRILQYRCVFCCVLQTELFMVVDVSVADWCCKVEQQGPS